MGTPTIAINGSASNGGGASPDNAPFSIAGDYAQLIASGADAFHASGATVFDMDAGTLSMASDAQIGRVTQGVTVTADMVRQNQLLLNAIGSYCRENGIAIHVEALLTNPSQDDWTYQWLQPAVVANLPITAVEDDREIASSIPDTKQDFASYAKNEMAIVKQIVRYYPAVKIGEWEGGAPTTAIADWWSAYDGVAHAAGLPRISYVVADTSWNAPWITPPSAYQTWLVNLSQLVQANGMQLTVLLDGGRASTPHLWTAQSEQHAAMLARLGGVTADTLLIRTWGSAYPDAVLPINEPTTIGNDAAEIAATYPLYRDGAITVENTIAVTSVPQMIVTTNTAAAVGSVSLTWTATDVAAGARLAVVITDQTGELSAQRSGSGTVSGGGTNLLILNGNSADVAAELQSLTVVEPTAGPDSIDIETFGINGRLSDSQISLISLTVARTSAAQEFKFVPGSVTQFWTAASASTNAAHVITSINYTWNSSDASTEAGRYRIVKSISIHEPMAEDGVTRISGVLEEPDANPAPGSSSSLPLNLSAFIAYAFNPADHLSTVNVLSTTLTFGAVTGDLLSINDTLSATSPTALISGATLLNYFAAGGTQITQLNTGGNPNWQSSWSTNLASVTTTYGSNNQILEQSFLGGTSEPWFVLDNVFDPYTGALWEQFETTPPPAPFDNFATGDQYVTQFNTGDNPNWDYADWGGHTQVTVKWEDYYAKAVTSIPPVRTGLQNTDAYSSTSQLSLTGPTGGGGTLVGGNATTRIHAVGSDTIYAGLGTTTITTGTGHSTIYLSYGADSEVTIVSGGEDSIWTGDARLTITNIGATPDEVYAQGNQLSVGDNSSIDVIGDYNAVNIGNSSAITMPGSQNILDVEGTADDVSIGNASTIIATGTHDTFNLNGAADVCQAGSNNTVNLNGTTSSATAGTDTTAWFWGSGNSLTAGDRTKAWLVGDRNTLSAGDHSTIDLVGSASAAVLGSYGMVWEYGAGASAKLQSNGSINQYGTNEVGTGGAGTTGWQAGTANRLTVGDNSTINVVGDNDTASGGDGSTIIITGNYDLVSVGNSGNIFIYGSNETVSLRGAAHAQTISGFKLANGDRLDLTQVLAGVSLLHDLSNLKNYVSVVRSGSDSVLIANGPLGTDAVIVHGAGSLGLSDFVAHAAFVLPPH